jgi:hypothetical protein
MFGSTRDVTLQLCRERTRGKGRLIDFTVNSKLYFFMRVHHGITVRSFILRDCTSGVSRRVCIAIAGKQRSFPAFLRIFANALGVLQIPNSYSMEVNDEGMSTIVREETLVAFKLAIAASCTDSESHFTTGKSRRLSHTRRILFWAKLGLLQKDGGTIHTPSPMSAGVPPFPDTHPKPRALHCKHPTHLSCLSSSTLPQRT